MGILNFGRGFCFSKGVSGPWEKKTADFPLQHGAAHPCLKCLCAASVRFLLVIPDASHISGVRLNHVVTPPSPSSVQLLAQHRDMRPQLLQWCWKHAEGWRAASAWWELQLGLFSLEKAKAVGVGYSWASPNYVGFYCNPHTQDGASTLLFPPLAASRFVNSSIQGNWCWWWLLAREHPLHPWEAAAGRSYSKEAQGGLFSML